MVTNQKKPAAAWYALRRTLPLWSFEKNLKELEDFLPRYKVDEVVVKVDTEEFWHGQPHLEWVEAYIPRLFEIKERLAALGIEYSLNPWVTVGHCDRGRDDRMRLQGFQELVGHDGTYCKACACPLGDIWKENTEKVWTLYAHTRPKVMWVEDDIRTFNHEPVKYSCFCSLHLERFSERVGESVSREALVAAILGSGKPHPWRTEYLDMQAEVMIEMAEFLAKITHRISPTTAMGLMSSGPRQHCLEGRQWMDFGRTLADGPDLYSRPPMGNYWETSLRGFYYSQDSIKITRHCLPPGTIEQTEVENIPFTRYSKSVAFTFLEMAISFAYGSRGVTLNLFDHSGTPMEDEGWYGRMLEEKKPFLELLAEKAQLPGTYRGVRLLHFEKSSYYKELPKSAEYGDLLDESESIMEVLEGFGIPTTFDESEVIAISGQQIRAASDAEIAELLKKAILLDGEAAFVLAERGFGQDIGLSKILPSTCIDDVEVLAAEELHNEQFGGESKRFMTLTIPSLMERPWFCPAEVLSEVSVISAFVDADAVRKYPSMFAYENDQGGRVVVHLLDLAASFGIAFMHPHRMAQYQSAVDWLYRGEAPLLVAGGVYPLTFRKDSGKQTLIGFFNLSLDPWETVEFKCYDLREVESVTLLVESEWKADPCLTFTRNGCNVKVLLKRAVNFDVPIFLTINWRE